MPNQPQKKKGVDCGENKGGSPVIRKPVRRGIVAIATVTTSLRYDDEPEIIIGKRPYYWNYKAKTNTKKYEECRERECLSLDELGNLLRQTDFCARIPGGLMELKKSQFDRISDRFLQLIQR